MKLSLVVATGAHQGKVIEVPGTQFLIGRDEGCHLRPASPAISKKHCAVFVRNGQVFVRDLGSTNGTLVNDEAIQGDQPVKDGDRLKVGPLDFALKIEGGGPTSDSTPLPESLTSVSKARATGTPAGGMMPASKKRGMAVMGSDEHDAAAALLLGMGDEDPPGSEPQIPEGSTVMELPAVNAGDKPADDKKKGTPNAAEMSAAASDILRKYMRRPK